MFSNKRILLADDSEMIRIGVTKILNQLGYNNIECAIDGLDAKSKISSHPYDLVLLDYHMPGLNGKQVLSYIKAHHPELLVIILSSTDEREVIVELMRKASNFVIKDDMECIKETLSNVIKKTFEEEFLRKENERLMNEIKERDETTKVELHSAKYLIDKIYPPHTFKTNAFDIRIETHASHVIGGDYYFTKQLNQDQSFVLLADVCGHGIPAALFLFTLRAAIDKAVLGEASPDVILKRLNDLLIEMLPQEAFITCTSCILDDRNKTLTFSNSSQNPLFYLKNDGSVVHLDDKNIPMLCIAGYDYMFQKTTIAMEPGERVFLITDGITEARSEDNKKDQFGTDPVDRILGETASNNLHESIRTIYKMAMDFAHHKLDDDSTIIGIQAL